MFLTRSKTSSALNHEKYRNKDNVFTPIPNDMISVLQDAVPSIDFALKPVLSEPAHELVLNMISNWITTSRISSNNFSNNSNKKQKPVNLRSWASRSFSVRSKSVVPQKTEISDPKLCRTPSFTDSESSSSSFSIASAQQHDVSPLMYAPLLLDTVGSPATVLIEKQVTSRLPVSIKSRIDLLDSPPPMPADAKSLSFIEESLSPLSSTFFHDNEHIDPPPVDSPASVIAASFTTASENNDESIITGVSKDSKSVRRSFSTIFSQLGHSVKKVFKKKVTTSESRLKKTMSVQHSLRHHASSPLNLTTKNQMYSSLRSHAKLPYERPKVYLESFATYIPTEPVNSSQVQVYGSCPSSVSSLHSHVSSKPLDTNMQNDYWDGEVTQSQQFDQLLDDIWERSQEYQDYFAAEQKMGQSDGSFSTNFNNHFKNNALWSPTINEQQTKMSSNVVRPSKTEVNMKNLDDSVPFVSVGKQQLSQDVTVSNKRKSQQLKGHLNIEDIKAYKRSTSAYSNIRDYDLNWQESFHVEQKSRDKVAKTLKSVSWAFYNIIKRNHNLNDFACDAIFSENEYQVSDGSTYNLCAEPLTDWNDIYDQLAYVFDCGELTAEHAIITFIYVKRMLDLSRQSLWDFSWRMIVMSSLLTAVKVWDDCAIFNADFAMIFPELTLDVINTIERVFLTHLEWDVSVNCSDFARTYFHLRDIEHMMDQW